MSFFSATSGGSSSSFTILSVSLFGILAFSILLLAYYLFLTRSSWRLDVVLTKHHIRSSDPAPYPVAPALGLDHAAIRQIPTFRYPHPQEASNKCTVCLSEFRDRERLRLLPPCLHTFHIECIDAWIHTTAASMMRRRGLRGSPFQIEFKKGTRVRSSVPAKKKTTTPSWSSGDEAGGRRGLP